MNLREDIINYGHQNRKTPKHYIMQEIADCLGLKQVSLNLHSLITIKLRNLLFDHQKIELNIRIGNEYESKNL